MACTGHIDLPQFQQEYGIMVLVTVCDLILPMFIVLLTAAVTVMCAFFQTIPNEILRQFVPNSQKCR